MPWGWGAGVRRCAPGRHTLRAWQRVVRSVNVGSPRGGIRPTGRESAIDKRPVGASRCATPVRGAAGWAAGWSATTSASRKHHGGSRQAVYAVAREELDWWGAQLGRDPARRDVRGEPHDLGARRRRRAWSGERWRVGSALLEVTGPRIPCATFAAWMGERGWVRRFTERGRTGAYLAVVEPGVMSAGDAVVVGRGPTTGSPSRRCSGRSWVTPLARRVLDAGILGDEDHAALEPASPP